MPTKNCTVAPIVKFLWENIITRYGCPLSLTSERGTHFINETNFRILLDEFMIAHHKTTPYHPQANGNVEAFNKIFS